MNTEPDDAVPAGAEPIDPESDGRESIRPGAPAVIVSGGVGVPARKWREVADGLRDRERDDDTGPAAVIVTERSAPAATFAEEVDRLVRDLRGARRAGARPVILVAHSAAGFFAEAAVRANPGLVDGVLLLDVSATAEAGEPSELYEKASHALGSAADAVAHRVVPALRRGEVTTLLRENAAFRRWARDLREHRRTARTEASVDAAPSAVPAVAAVTDVVAVPKWKMLAADAESADPGSTDAESTGAHDPDHADDLRIWAQLTGDADGGHLREVVLAPCGHMVMTDRPGDVVAEISALIERIAARGRG
ncbi:alpha/beta fold hydrolase [uncultured Corynebacterium sp.]|uniref:alpha/beta fold hydrolase n=1 Tax=uncultured Corynebacterium sp. TaxID=159447 RepID=UPI0025E1A2AA|nr:alpha/beta hydrolase [uncultured Corynebacterium sp.]